MGVVQAERDDSTVLLTERYADRGVVTCFDRIIITGTFRDICHAHAMPSTCGSREFVCSTSPAGQSPCGTRYAITPNAALEPCLSFKPWHDKKTGRNLFKPDDGKCIHYYFYFIDEELCHLRVPTWAPFRLQFYFNFPRAQLLADRIRARG